MTESRSLDVDVLTVLQEGVGKAERH